jgi:hypothetical protein
MKKQITYLTILASLISLQLSAQYCFNLVPGSPITIDSAQYIMGVDSINTDNYKDVILMYNDNPNPSANNTIYGFPGNNIPGQYGVSTSLINSTSPKTDYAYGDFNNDNINDIAYINFTNIPNVLNDTVFVKMASSLGNYFTPTVKYHTGCAVNTFITQSKVNSDNYMDLVILGRDQNFTKSIITFMYGSSNGSFATSNTYTTSSKIHELRMLDINNDTKNDLIYTTIYPSNLASDSLFVLTQTSLGTFTLTNSFDIGISTLSTNRKALDYLDVNLDGKLDISVLDHGNNQFRIALASGNAFLTPTAAISLASGNGVYAGVFPSVDLDNNGNADYIVKRLLLQGVFLDIGFETPTGYSVHTLTINTNGQDIKDVSCYDDINNDGKKDIVVITSTKMYVYLNCSITTDVNTTKNELKQISIAPNPTTNTVKLQNLTEEVNLTVYNVLGEVMISTKVNATNNEVQLTTFPNGIYNMVLTSKNAMRSIKVIKH